MAAKEPEIIRDKDEMRKWSRAMRSQGKTIGLVPTMGFLHEGHISLIREARNHADLIAVSIYVNPGQFSPSEDLSTYPSDFHGDIRKLMAVPGGVDVVFNPHNFYDYGTSTDPCVSNGGVEGREAVKVVSCVEERGLGHETWVRVERLEKGMCGKSRPVFFRGVATIVTKLFNVVEPDIAVFGKKDYQQWRIIQRMVRDLDFSIRVIGTDIVRENDGLAMSSRNVRLSPAEREKALSINKSLSRARFAAEKGQINCKELRDLVIQAISEADGRVDYAEVSMEELPCLTVLDSKREQQNCGPRKFRGSRRYQKSCCVLCCCVVWKGQTDRQHGDQHMNHAFLPLRMPRSLTFFNFFLFGKNHLDALLSRDISLIFSIFQINAIRFQ